MRMIRRPRVDARWIAIAVLGGAVAAGCGSAGASSETVTNAPNLALQFAQCMRANGVPNFPDGPITPASGINPQSPAFESAGHACRKYLHSSGHPPPIPASVRHAALRFANCVRANGVPNFPDPGPDGAIQFPLGSPIPRSPAFQHAQDACKKYMRGDG
jgi:hypothetical protein